MMGDSTINLPAGVEEVEEETSDSSSDSDASLKEFASDSRNPTTISTATGSLSTTSLVFEWRIPYLRRDQKQKLTSPTTKLPFTEGINSSIWSLQLSVEEVDKGDPWLSVYLWLRHVVKWPNVHSKGLHINYKIDLLGENGDGLCSRESGIRYLAETSAVGWKKYSPLSKVFSFSDFLSSSFTLKLHLTALNTALENHFPLQDMRDSYSWKSNRMDLHFKSSETTFQELCSNVALCKETETEEGNSPPHCAIVCGTKVRVLPATLVAAHSVKLGKMIMEGYRTKLDDSNCVRIQSTHSSTPGVRARVPKIPLKNVSEECFELMVHFLRTSDVSLTDEDLDFHQVCELTKAACLYEMWMLAIACFRQMTLSWLSVDNVSHIALISDLLPRELGLQEERQEVKQYFQKNWSLVKESDFFLSSIAHQVNKKVLANLLLL